MKKYLFFLILFFLTNNLFSENREKEVQSKITNVKVFLEGAQIFREAEIILPKGKSTLVFKGLSSFIDKNSIRVNGQGAFTILSVKNEMNFLQESDNPKDKIAIKENISSIETEIEKTEAAIRILNERKAFLTANKQVITSDGAVDPTTLAQFSDFFAKSFEDIEMKILAKNRELNELTIKLASHEKQLEQSATKEKLPTTEITVEVDSKTESQGIFNISYLISNAGWHPSYDLRVENIDNPVSVTYKANIYQNSGIDWKNVQLTFSNVNPDEQATTPVLYPYRLSFNNNRFQSSILHSYDPNIREVEGVVVDAQTGEKTPFANISVKGTSVATATDYDGKFSLIIPKGATTLRITYIGYEPKEIPISQPYIKIGLEPAINSLEEVVVTAEAIPKRSKKGEVIDAEIVDVSTIKRQTSFEFKIESPYTIKSNSGQISIDIKKLTLESGYQYESVPKISERAFLVALITEWQEHDLLDGEINLYFENTFVGKSLLDISMLNDTLQVPLGPDKGIVILRQLEKEFSSRQFIGSNKIEKRRYKISLRNNKSTEVKINVFDQVPISTDDDIEIEVVEISGGELDQDTGIIKWEIVLKPNEVVDKAIEYSVKYPKGKRLNID